MNSGLRIWLTVIVLFAVLPIHAAETDEPLRAMTFNIRYGTAPDGENSWRFRKDMLFSVIRDYQPHLLGLQESLREQLDELAAEFPNHVSIGVGRKADGSGEYAALLFDRTRLDLMSSGSFWLSDTPDIRGSQTWGNHYSRICTWARFIDRNSGKTLSVFNTHWDHQSQRARVGSGKLIAKRIRKLPSLEPVILMGDFNVGPKSPARQPFDRLGLRETFFQMHSDETEVGTFNGFEGMTDGKKIDAILVNEKWDIVDASIDHTHQGNRYPSDHFPVTADLRMRPAP